MVLDASSPLPSLCLRMPAQKWLKAAIFANRAPRKKDAIISRASAPASARSDVTLAAGAVDDGQAYSQCADGVAEGRLMLLLLVPRICWASVVQPDARHSKRCQSAALDAFRQAADWQRLRSCGGPSSSADGRIRWLHVQCDSIASGVGSYHAVVLSCLSTRLSPPNKGELSAAIASPSACSDACLPVACLQDCH